MLFRYIEGCFGDASAPGLAKENETGKITSLRIVHDLRRTAVRNLVRAGIHERLAMQLTGHKTGSVFERYNVSSGSDLREAAKKLNAAAKALGHSLGTVASETNTPIDTALPTSPTN